MSIFDKAVDRRNSNADKWDKALIKDICGNPDADAFWVADMDLATSPIIKEVLQKPLNVNEILRRGDEARKTTNNEEEITKAMGTLYYENRDKFNSLPIGDKERIKLFFWITRMCFNGLIRYNPKGKFNASFHVANRQGISPAELQKTFDLWSKVLDNVDIKFYCKDYKEVIADAKEGDVIYMDPPYENVTGMYFAGIFNNKEMFDVIRNLTKNNVKIFMSYDGKSGSADNTSTSVPDDLFARHIYVNSGHSPFKKLKSKSVGTDNKAMLYDSLYINY